MLIILTLCFGIVATLPYLLTGMEQKSEQKPPIGMESKDLKNENKVSFIDQGRTDWTCGLEKLEILRAGSFSKFILAKIKANEPFASSQTHIENKLNDAVDGFISLKDITGLTELLELCTAHSLPLQAGAQGRARHFFQAAMAHRCNSLRSQFEQDFKAIQNYQNTLQRLDASEKGSTLSIIQKPVDLFLMLYSDGLKGMILSSDKNPGSEKPTDTENPFIMDPKNPTS